MARDETPDILGTLTVDKKPATKPVKRQNVKAANRQVGKVSPVSPLAEYIADTDKVKATAYYSEDTTERIEAAQAKLRRAVGKTSGKAKRAVVTKSLLAEIFGMIVLDDFEQNGTDSAIEKLPIAERCLPLDTSAT